MSLITVPDRSSLGGVIRRSKNGSMKAGSVRAGLEDRAAAARISFRRASSTRMHREPSTNLVKWTETYRKLPKSTTLMTVDAMEVTRGPYLWCTEPGVKQAGLMACTQSGKTTVMESICGYFMHTDPAPILYVGPRIPDAVQFVDEKLMAMVAATDVLKPLVSTKRNSGNRNTLKRFPGGRIRAGGTDARGLFTMVADRIVLLDEVDGHEDAGGDGDTFELSLGRVAEYQHNYLLFAVSSPTVKDRSVGDKKLPTIYKFFKSSDERLPFVQCQKCGHDHFMDFEVSEGVYSLAIPKRMDDERGTFVAERAGYVCPKCGAENTNNDRVRMLQKGAIHWRATKPFKCCNVWQDPRARWEACDQTQADYDAQWQPYGEDLGVESPAPIGGIASHGTKGVCRAKCQTCGTMPVSNRIAVGHYGRYYRKQYSLEEMAEGFIRVIRDPAKRKAFWNTILGLPFEDRKLQSMSADSLNEQGEAWDEIPATEGSDEPPRYFVPWGVAVETMGIDVQEGKQDGSFSRFAVERVGWGAGEESWSISYEEPPANTRDVSEWDRVLIPRIREMTKRADGRPFKAMAVCIDANNNPDQASDFVARWREPLMREHIHLFAVQGIGERGSRVYRTWAGSAANAKAFEKWGDPAVKLWNIGTREAKDTVHQYLNRTSGPGTMHFPNTRTRHWTDGLLAEDNVIEGGRAVWKHLRKSVPNEPLDCRVYALAGLRAMQSIYQGFNLDEMAAYICGKTPEMVAREAEDAPESSEVDQRPSDDPIKPLAPRRAREADSGASEAAPTSYVPPARNFWGT